MSMEFPTDNYPPVEAPKEQRDVPVSKLPENSWDFSLTCPAFPKCDGKYNIGYERGRQKSPTCSTTTSKMRYKTSKDTAAKRKKPYYPLPSRIKAMAPTTVLLPYEMQVSSATLPRDSIKLLQDLESTIKTEPTNVTWSSPQFLPEQVSASITMEECTKATLVCGSRNWTRRNPVSQYRRDWCMLYTPVLHLSEPDIPKSIASKIYAGSKTSDPYEFVSSD